MRVHIYFKTKVSFQSVLHKYSMLVKRYAKNPDVVMKRDSLALFALNKLGVNAAIFSTYVRK